MSGPQRTAQRLQHQQPRARAQPRRAQQHLPPRPGKGRGRGPSAPPTTLRTIHCGTCLSRAARGGARARLTCTRGGAASASASAAASLSVSWCSARSPLPSASASPAKAATASGAGRGGGGGSAGGGGGVPSSAGGGGGGGSGCAGGCSGRVRAPSVASSRAEWPPRTRCSASSGWLCGGAGRAGQGRGREGEGG
jgi:hypothetical protein